MSLTVLVGTTKGVFLLDGDSERREWRLRGPFCGLWPINHVIGEAGTGRLWAAGGGPWQGAGVWRSEDHGGSWTLAKLTRGQADDWAEADPELASRVGYITTPEAPFNTEFEAIGSVSV